MLTVKVRKTENGKRGVKATVTVYIDDKYAVNSILVCEDKEKRLYVSFPQRFYKDKNGKNQSANIFIPVSEEAKTEMVQAILDAYNAEGEPTND